MNPALRAAWVNALALLVSFSAYAQELGVRGGVSPLQNKGRFSLVVENDLFALGGETTDRFYSNGIFVHSEWSSPTVTDYTTWLALPGFAPADNRGYLGIGVSHELHTPKTLNPCRVPSDDPLATSDNPRNSEPGVCQKAGEDWQQNYAPRDRPFAAVGSVFLTFQRYFHARRSSGPLNQYRVWARVDVGQYGPGAVKGYEVQKHWHGFFNEALLEEGGVPASTPTGWKLVERGGSSVLGQLSAGTEVDLYRLIHPRLSTPVGAEALCRARALVGAPRNMVSVGFAVRAGILPQHTSEPMTGLADYQASHVYLEASAEAAPVVTDLTYGDFDRYRHFLDEYGLGFQGKAWGWTLSGSLQWQRILFRDPLLFYPSTDPILDLFHRYGRVALEFTY